MIFITNITSIDHDMDQKKIIVERIKKHYSNGEYLMAIKLENEILPVINRVIKEKQEKAKEREIEILMRMD